MPHPIAIGLLWTPGALLDRRRRARLRIAVHAHAGGYALLETIDASAPLIGLDGAFEAIGQLSRAHDVRVVLALGLDEVSLLPLARTHGLLTVRVSEQADYDVRGRAASRRD